MMIDLQYVQRRKNHYRYRRKVPAALQEAAGKREIVLPLGKTESEVLKRWPKAHKEAESQLAAAVLSAGSSKAPAPARTPLERYKWANDHLLELGFNPNWRGQEDPDDPEAIAREVTADAIAAKYLTDDEGYASNIEGRDADLLRALTRGAAAAKPQPTLEDARRFYIREKVEGTPDYVKKIQRVDRVVAHIRKSLGSDPVLINLTRADAREVRDYMLGDAGIKPTTVHRYLNDVRAIINFAIEELPLLGVTNPFNKLEVRIETVAKDERKPFSTDQLAKTRSRIECHASKDIQQIWRILEGTGARLGEVAGLLVTDVVLNHKVPYLDLVFHPHRRLKNKGSIRKVPLVGDALDSARDAVSAAGTNPLLFSRYANEKGRTAASAILMKHLRKVVTDRKITVHSLRHTMKDKLRLGSVEAGTIDDILGHSSGKVSERYGGDDARLELGRAALESILCDRQNSIDQ